MNTKKTYYVVMPGGSAEDAPNAQNARSRAQPDQNMGSLSFPDGAKENAESARRRSQAAGSARRAGTAGAAGAARDAGAARTAGAAGAAKTDGAVLRRRYLGAAVFILIFSRIYNYFGHGVASAYMDTAWLIPLCCFLWYLALLFARRRTGTISANALAAGCATMTCGFLLQGILEIAGTASPYLPAFFWIGGILLAGGIAAALIGWIRIR